MLFVQKQQKHFHLTENVETTNSYSILESATDKFENELEKEGITL